MAIATGQASVTTSITQIDGTCNSPFKLVLHNSGTNAIYIGASDVTSSTGLGLESNTTLTLELPAGQYIYAIAATGTHTLGWMRIQ